MRSFFNSWGLILTTLCFLTLFSVVDAASHKSTHRKRGQLHHADRVLPAGTGSGTSINVVNDSNDQDLSIIYEDEATRPENRIHGPLHTSKRHHSASGPNVHRSHLTSSRAKKLKHVVAESTPENGHTTRVARGLRSKLHAPAVIARAVTDDSGCPQTNGTDFVSAAGTNYQTICSINIPGQDLPFQSVANFTECVAACDAINTQAGENNCLAIVFTPGRIGDANDCYLKYATSDATTVDSAIEGAILIPGLDTVSLSTSATTSSGPTVVYASGSSVIVPTVAFDHLDGPTTNQPTEQYIQLKLPPDLVLPSILDIVGVEDDLSTNYPISPDTGNLMLNATTEPLLAPLTDTPHLSRDGGKGGILNGQHLFVFCDTGSYSTTTDNTNGNFLAFVCSSVATDIGMNALYGNPIVLEDGIGGWSDNVGRMRGFVPLTAGEQGYNLVMQGKGQRYAIWPEASIIPLEGTTALLYAPIVYDNVDESTGVATFTYTGATLLTVTAGNSAGPSASRTVDRIFQETEVEWGCIGGIRSWGPSGIGGSDGMVYIFGNVRGGLLLARSPPSGVASRSSYQYWTGNGWSYGMQSPTSTAYFITGSFMDVDVFYSPRHLTFICVYMTIYADSTFYYRYLMADQGILPPFAPGGDSSVDYVSYLTQYNWSPEQTLYVAGPGMDGAYSYAGGVHQGYFGQDDITNGGSKMLLSWTAPTGLNPATETSEYQICTAEIDWV